LAKSKAEEYREKAAELESLARQISFIPHRAEYLLDAERLRERAAAEDAAVNSPTRSGC